MLGALGGDECAHLRSRKEGRVGEGFELFEVHAEEVSRFEGPDFFGGLGEDGDLGSRQSVDLRFGEACDLGGCEVGQYGWGNEAETGLGDVLEGGNGEGGELAPLQLFDLGFRKLRGLSGGESGHFLGGKGLELGRGEGGEEAGFEGGNGGGKRRDGGGA